MQPHPHPYRAIIKPTRPRAPAAAPDNAVCIGIAPPLLELLVGPLSALDASLMTLLAPLTPPVMRLVMTEPALSVKVLNLLDALETADVMVEPAESVKVLKSLDALEIADVMVEPAESVKVLKSLDAFDISEVMVEPAESVNVVKAAPAAPVGVMVDVKELPAESVPVVVKTPV